MPIIDFSIKTHLLSLSRHLPLLRREEEKFPLSSQKRGLGDEFVLKAILMILVFLSLSHATTLNFKENENKKVYSIEYVNASDSLLEQIKSKELLLKEGRIFTYKGLFSDINEIYNIGTIQDIEYYIENQSNGLKIKYFISETDILKGIELIGETVFPNGEIEGFFLSGISQKYNLNLINNAISKIEQIYVQNGYSFAKVKEVYFDKARNILQVHIDEGIVEDIEFLGLEFTKDWVVGREFESKKGKPLNINTLKEDRERLLAMGYFSFISTPKFSSGKELNQIKISFMVKERETNSIGLGLEQLPNNKLGLVSDLKFNNLWGVWQSLSFRGQADIANNLGLSNGTYSLSYRDPWFMSNNVDFFLNLSDKVADERPLLSPTTYKINRIGYSILWEFPIIRDHMQTFLGFDNENISELASSQTINPYQKNSIKTGLIFDVRNNKRETTEGGFLDLEVAKGGNMLINLQGIDFLRAKADMGWFFPFTKDIQLGTHLSLGYYNSPVNIATLGEEVFYIGGAYSLRGYTDYAIANASQIISGRQKILTNLELRIRTSEFFQLVFFTDIGDAYDNKFDANSLKKGMGFGFRLTTPIAPLRLDFAWGESKDVFVHFGLGQMF